MAAPVDKTVSIGLPVYDRTRYVAEAIQSCLDQDYAALEILVSDDSRDDGIERICDGFHPGAVRYIRHEHPYSLIEKMNDLLEQASGDWMLFLGDDDSLNPSFIRHMLQMSLESPEATLLRSHYRLIDGDGHVFRQETGLPGLMDSIDFLERIFLSDYRMNIAGVMFPRLLLKELGGFSVLPTLWDSDRIAWAKLASQGACRCDSQALCNLRVHTDAESVRFNSDFESMIQTGFGVNKEIHSMLDGLSGQAPSPGKLQRLAGVRSNLDSYTRSQLIRALDQGMFCVLDGDSDHTRAELKMILKRCKELEVGPFLSASIYRILGWVPRVLRKPVLKYYKQYKLAKSMR